MTVDLVPSSASVPNSSDAGRGSVFPRSQLDHSGLQHARLLRGIALTGAILLGAVVAWPAATSLRGIDASWMDGLHAAAQLGLRQGVDVAFSFGPLGFVLFPWPFVGWTSALAFGVVLALNLSLAGVVLSLSRRAFALPLALLVLLVTMRLTVAVPGSTGFEFLEVLVLGAAVLLLERAGPPHMDVLMAGAGLIAGAALLGKVNAGLAVVVIVLTGAAALGRPWWRGLAIAAGACAASALVLWLLAGQRVGDLPAFVSAAAETVAGYATAMSYPTPAGWLPRAAAVVEIVILTALAILASRGWPSRRRVALSVAWGVFAASLFLEGFTRDTPLHNTYFFVGMALAGLVFLPRNRQSWNVLIMSGLVAVAVLAWPDHYAGLANPISSVSRFVSDAKATLRPWYWEAEAAKTGRRILAAYRVDPGLLSLLEGRTVHFEPVDAALAFGLPRTTWDPEPVYQSYAAYTAVLDDMNATFLRGPGAPDRMLRRQVLYPAVGPQRPISIDGRLRWWEQPSTTLAMICRYRELAAVGRWQVLSRGPNRCGPPRTVATEELAVGQEISISVVPAPDEVLLVRISQLPTTLLERARALLFGTDPWYAIVDGVPYRLVPGTVGDGLLLSVPATLAWSERFSFGTPIRSLAIVGGGAPAGMPLTLSFQVVPLPNSR